MSDLNIGPPPSSNPTRSIVAAAAILLLAATAVFIWMSRQKAELMVIGVKPYVARVENKPLKMTGKGPHVVGTPSSFENDLYLVVSVRVVNHLHEPMFIKDETFTVTSPDQSVAAADALQKNDLDNAVAAFPGIQPLLGTPLTRDTKIAPGQTVEGTLLVPYPLANEDFWTKRTSASATLTFFHQPDLTAEVPK